MAGMKDHTGTAPAGPRRSRRTLLASGAGALAAVVTAEALARPAPAAADNGGNVILGQENTETAVTVIKIPPPAIPPWKLMPPEAPALSVPAPPAPA